MKVEAESNHLFDVLRLGHRGVLHAGQFRACLLNCYEVLGHWACLGTSSEANLMPSPYIPRIPREI